MIVNVSVWMIACTGWVHEGEAGVAVNQVCGQPTSPGSSGQETHRDPTYPGWWEQLPQGMGYQPVRFWVYFPDKPPFLCSQFFVWSRYSYWIVGSYISWMMRATSLRYWLPNQLDSEFISRTSPHFYVVNFLFGQDMRVILDSWILHILDDESNFPKVWTTKPVRFWVYFPDKPPFLCSKFLFGQDIYIG